jgi:hypothetical protein
VDWDNACAFTTPRCVFWRRGARSAGDGKGVGMVGWREGLGVAREARREIRCARAGGDGALSACRPVHTMARIME